MTSIESQWSIVRRHVAEQMTPEQLALCREMFFGGALSMLSILSEVSKQAASDREFNASMRALFEEASSAVLERYTYVHPCASNARH